MLIGKLNVVLLRVGLNMLWYRVGKLLVMIGSDWDMVNYVENIVYDKTVVYKLET